MMSENAYVSEIVRAKERMGREGVGGWGGGEENTSPEATK